MIGNCHKNLNSKHIKKHVLKKRESYSELKVNYPITYIDYIQNTNRYALFIADYHFY